MICIDSKSERLLKTVTIILTTALVIFILISYSNVQQDDSYIFNTYAKNISSGNGYVFNQGEKINAITSTLYTLILASTYFLLRWLPFITIPVTGHLIGATSLWIITLLSMKVFRRTGFKIVPFIFPVLFLANPLLKNSIGMESFLTLALIMLSLYLYQKEKLFWVSAVCALAVLSRPDSVIVPFILMADYVMTKRKLVPLGSFAIFILILLPWIIFSYLYFHTVLPTTLSVKLGQTQSGRWGTGFLFLKGLLSTAWPYAKLTKWPVAISMAISAVYLIVTDREWARHRVVALILIWNFVYLICYGIILNPPAYPWYYTPLSVGMTLILALVPEMAARKLHLQAGFGSIFFLLIAISSAALILPLKSLSEPVTAKYENYKRAAQWLNDNAFEGATVAANEIGVLGYFYERGKVIDALGLITPGVSDHVRQQDYTWYIDEYQPDFLMFNYPNRPKLEAMVHTQWFQEKYRRVAIIDTKRRAVAIYQRQL